MPVVKGYHADKKSIADGKVTQVSVNKKVTYTANGHIIPVDVDGNKIAGAPTPVFETDPKDPTQVLDQQAVPTIEGYSCDIKTTAPYDPAKDLEITYKAEKDDDVLVIPVGQKKRLKRKSLLSQQRQKRRKNLRLLQNQKQLPQSLSLKKIKTIKLQLLTLSIWTTMVSN